MDESTKALYCSLYEFLEANKLSSTKKSFLKETKFDTSCLKDASVHKVSLKQMFQDHLATQKKEAIKEESSDSSSSSDSDSDSDSEDEEKPVAKKVAAAADSSSDSDSDSSSDSEDEEKPVAKKVAAAADSSSDSDSDSSSDSEDEEKPVAKKVAAAADSSSDSDSDSSSDSEDEEKPVATKRKAEAIAESSSSDSDSSSGSDTKLVVKKGAVAEAPASKKLKADGEAEAGAANCKAYVKGLPWVTSEQELSDFFADCPGKIVTIELPLGEGGRSSGTAFITFDSRAGLDGAMAKDEAIWPGTERWLKITEAKSFDAARGPATERPAGCDTVFVGNLPWDVEESQLMELFSSCGDVQQVRFAMGEDGSFRGFAHVRFGAEESTNAAVALFGTDINGRAIRVDFAPPRNRESLGGGKGGGRGGFGGKGGDGGRGGGGKGGKGGKGGGRGSFSASRGSIASPQGTKMTFDDY
jgi:nucleolin